jgi:hypothetical protein
VTTPVSPETLFAVLRRRKKYMNIPTNTDNKRKPPTAIPAIAPLESFKGLAVEADAVNELLADGVARVAEASLGIA